MKKYEDMIYSVHQRIDEYKAARIKKRAKITKITAVVAPVCAAVIISIGVWRGGLLSPEHDLIQADVTVSSKSVIDNNKSMEAAPNVNESVSPESSIKSADRPLISSYSSDSASMSVPKIGELGLSMGLYNAKEEYGESADYLVKADIFTESGQVFDHEKLQAETERIKSLGYNVTVESEPMQADEAYYYLKLNLTYEQISDFPVAEYYAYVLRLYDE